MLYPIDHKSSMTDRTLKNKDDRAEQGMKRREGGLAQQPEKIKSKVEQGSIHKERKDKSTANRAAREKVG